MVRVVLLAVACSIVGCEPKLVVGKRTAPSSNGGTENGGTENGGTENGGADGGDAETGGTENGGAANATGNGGAAGQAGAAGEAEAGAAGAMCAGDGGPLAATTDPVALPWSTGFENDFCDYIDAGGFCFGGGSRKVVTSPVHSGRYAAEFSVKTNDSAHDQTRCVRQGVLPSEAYYGAWYYVPSLATLDETKSPLWNLLHFQGGDKSQTGLWDVTLVNSADGGVQLLVFDFLAGVVRQPVKPPPIPIGTWFHIQFYLKRASDATGAIRLYQNGKLLLEKTGIITDDSSWGQWYVGNLAKDLTAPVSTLYVDDVTIDTVGISL